MQNALRNFLIAHAQFANVWPKPDCNPNHNRKPDPDSNLTRTATLIPTLDKSRSVFYK